MSRSPMIVRTVPALRRALDRLKAKTATTALVPTMGALHDGPVSLLMLAKRAASGVMVSGTARERDSLAMSSRDVNLSPEERRTAPVLYRAMKEAARRLRAGDDLEAATAGGAELAAGAGFALDYFEVRHAGTLAPIASAKDGPMRILTAARIGTTRLIDNVAV